MQKDGNPSAQFLLDIVVVQETQAHQNGYVRGRARKLVCQLQFFQSAKREQKKSSLISNLGGSCKNIKYPFPHYNL